MQFWGNLFQNSININTLYLIGINKLRRTRLQHFEGVQKLYETSTMVKIQIPVA